MYNYPIIRKCRIAVIGFILIATANLDADNDVVTVTLKGDETLRSLAIKYFGEPNDWEVILFYNGYQSPSEVEIGSSLKIPVGLYRRVTTGIVAALEKISRANSEGAGILAKELVVAAVAAQKSAVELKKAGQLDEALAKAQHAVRDAQQAIEETKAKRIRSVSAILSGKRGKVQSRRQKQTIWYDADRNQDLIEKEHIRTLSGASGEISFVDGSKLNLGANALAVIEAMKQDLIINSNQSSVVVMQGDIMAYLASQSKKNNVNVSVPGVETDIRSRKFRASRDENNVSRFANYDGEIDVSAGGKTVTIQKDEGTSIQPGKAPEEARKLLPAPEITSPSSKARIFSTLIELQWKSVQGAVRYQLQLSDKRGFSTVADELSLTKNGYTWKAPQTGVYYARVAAIDGEGFIGPYSDLREFYVDEDKTPPYLLVESPGENDNLYAGQCPVEGVVEKLAMLTINGAKISVPADGNFREKVDLQPGRNQITVVATDPAGNVSRVRRTVYYSADDKLIYLDITEERVYTNSTEFAITGEAKPGTRIRIDGQPVNLSENQLDHVVALKDGENVVQIEGTSTKGTTQTVSLKITLDRDPPQFTFDDIPSFTGEQSLVVSGRLSERGIIKSDNREIEVNDRDFRISVDLEEGDNYLDLIAVDNAGNQTETEIEIFRDTRSPRVKTVQLMPENVSAGGLVQLRVQAEDDGVGLARNGHFVVSIPTANQTFNGVLSLSGRGSYQGNIVVPPGVQGRLKVDEVRIQDYLGNEVVYP